MAIDDGEWLQALAPGDRVFVEYATGWALRRVTRVTKTQIVVRMRDGHELRFSRKDGWRIGRRAWNQTRLERFTDELWAERKLKAKHRDLCHRLSGYAFSTLSLSALEAIAKIIDSEVLPDEQRRSDDDERYDTY